MGNYPLGCCHTSGYGGKNHATGPGTGHRPLHRPLPKRLRPLTGTVNPELVVWSTLVWRFELAFAEGTWETTP